MHDVTPTSPAEVSRGDGEFRPPALGLRLSSRLLHATRGACAWLADRESTLLGSALAEVPLREPIFIAGVARSGSTLLLEALASLPSVASARYCDFPPVWFPYWWTRLREQLPLPTPAARMRAHGDGIQVTPLSPEACDELLWMHFFPQRHDPTVDQRLAAADQQARFDSFYARHIRKLLLARGAQRYLCKGNYNLLRLPYLRQLFPDARFVVPIRSPASQVQSLVRQHLRFSRLSARWPSVGRQLALSGHFEFGPQRRAECADVAEAVAIEAAFAAGDEVSGYARQWASSYGVLASWLEADPELANQVLLLPHERLCADPAATLRQLGEHCRIGQGRLQNWLASWQHRIQARPEPTLEATLLQTVEQHCGAVARRLGYGSITGALA